MNFSTISRRFFGAAALLYAAAWGTHLYIGTKALRGFFGDGALAFLIHLSGSYVFGGNSRWVHLFSVGFPRDFQILLNALGLQAALGFGITDPAALKYIFVFWQFALPGFLYLLLFFGLWRANKLPWALFPLISWTVLSVPVDWNAVNSTRWAVPIFWMHFFLVLFAGPKLRFGPAAAVLLTGAAMWGGLYESVVPQGALGLGTGALLWAREKNRIPFLYALAALPGAIRAVLSFLDIGRTAPNGFHGLVLPHILSQPYALLIVLSAGLVLMIGLQKKPPRHFIAGYGFALSALAGLGIAVLLGPYPNVWEQIEMRFDYVALSLALMAAAASLRIWGAPPAEFAALPAAAIALVAGSILWAVQAQQTLTWQTCIADYDARKGDSPLVIGASLRPLFQPSDKTAYMNPYIYAQHSQCLWDWTAPWTDLLRGSGKVGQWSLFTFWQEFSFVKKDGATWLHTNNWTLTSPSIQPSEAWLPLKTAVYDLTPLYQKLGDGPFVTRAACVDPEKSGGYWHDHLVALDDDRRRSMFVCPRQMSLSAP